MMTSSKALFVLLLIAASTASPVDLNKPDGPPPHARGFIGRMMDSVKPETIGDAAKNLCPDLLPETSSAAPVTTEPTETTASPVSPAAAPADTSAGLAPDTYIGEPFLYGYAGDEPVYYYPGDLDDAMLEDATYYYNTRSAREAKTDDCPFLTQIPETIVMNRDCCMEHDMAVHYMMSRQHINMHRGHFARSGSGDCGPSGRLSGTGDDAKNFKCSYNGPVIMIAKCEGLNLSQSGQEQENCAATAAPSTGNKEI